MTPRKSLARSTLLFVFVNMSNFFSKLAVPVIRVDRIYAFDPQGPTSIESNLQKPNTFYLAQNYPNPFNPTTEINYTLQQAGHATLTIYDLLGREIEKVVDEFKPMGSYNVLFDGRKLASGIYYYRLKVEDKFVETKKMILLK